MLDCGKKFSFHMVIFGRALKQFSLIVSAWRRALVHGLGGEQASARLVTVSQIEGGHQEYVWNEANPQQILPHDQSIQLKMPPGKNEMTLRFETPLRLQHKGKVLGSRQITTADLIAGCLRRVRSVSLNDDEQHILWDDKDLIEKAGILSGEHKLRYVKWSRYSSRQRQKMDLPGLVGDWHIRGELQPFLMALYICELFHVGKNTSFGLGKYTIEPSD